MDTVLILVPNYNKEKFLLKTIDSVINQTYANWKIILLDNNSKDNSVIKVIKKYNSLIESKQIVIIENKKNIGLVPNWNKGLKYVHNYKYYKILCSDDTIEKDHLSHGINLLKKTSSKYFAYGSQLNYINDKDQKIGKRRYGFFGLEFWISIFYRNYIGCPSSLIFKSEYHNNHKFIRFPYISDLLFLSNYYLEGKKVIYDKKYSANFRISNETETSKFFGSDAMINDKNYLRQYCINNLKINFILKKLLKIVSMVIHIFEVIFFKILNN